MTIDEKCRLIAYSLKNGGNPDLSELSDEEKRLVLNYLEQMM